MKQHSSQRRTVLTTLLFSSIALATGNAAPNARGQSGTLSFITLRFELPGTTGNPFDYSENDVLVELAGPGSRAFIVPAFFDGGTTWEVRCTPPADGKWRVKQITRNAKAVPVTNLQPKEFAVSRKANGGFIRLDPKNPLYFAYENGTPYYPIGCNAAWNSGKVTVEEFITQMGASGQNWSRVWMNHWDGKNLDWVQNEKVPLGQLSLTVARRWDSVVGAAERADVPFQIVLQHHGQYTKQVNPNWNDNPWNAQNGGFLKEPEEFFTNEKARQLTRAKYRYIIARWGYSPHVLAWELFNEVQFTDAGRQKQHAAIAAWHKEMAAFIRKHDAHKHLVTTSSDENITGLYDAMDYRQPHAYPSDVVATIRAVGNKFSAAQDSSGSEPAKPIFLGEIGTGLVDLSKDDGAYLQQIVWSSLMTPAPGAAQYWTWDNVANRDLVDRWKPATRFVKVFGLAGRRAMRPVSLAFTDANRGGASTSFGPGGDWGETKQTKYVVEASGDVPGSGAMTAYLQGNNNRALFPFAEFAVNYEKAGTFAVHIRQVSPNGANVVIKVDGVAKAEKAFPAAVAGNASDRQEPQTSQALIAPVPAGAHTIRLENTGTDWARIEKITLSPYGPPARTVAKADKESVAAWLYASDPAVSAAPLTITVSVPGLDAGKYRVFWWDTATGKAVATETATVATGKPLTLKTPPITENIALFAAHERTGKYTL